MGFDWIEMAEAIGIIVSICTLVHQLKEDRKSKAIRQASAVSAWISDKKGNNGNAVVCVSNKSELPIYEVVLSKDIVIDNKSKIGTTNAICAFVRTVPPGLYEVEVPDHGGGMYQQFDASISFRDAKGMNWCRDALGHLKKAKRSSIELRNLELPLGSSTINMVSD